MAQPARSFRLLSKLGFDRPKLIQGLEVATAAFLAIACAWALGFEHPQWAAITVFVTLQPTRGQILEKSSYRFFGTMLGCAFGALVAWGFSGNLGFELTALCLWSGVMVFLGALQRSYRSYGALLAGYSAIIVIVLDPFNPATVREVALDRIAVVSIGLFSAVLWAYLAKLQNADAEVYFKARRLCADILATCARAESDPALRDPAPIFKLVSATALLQDELHSLTSTRKTAKARQIEHLLHTLTNLIFALHQHHASPDLRAGLAKIAHDLHSQTTFNGSARHLRRLLGQTENPVLETALSSLMVALAAIEDDHSPLSLRPESRRRFALDWKGAAEAGLRITIVLGAISAAWFSTQNPVFQYSLVSAAICIALASTGASPRRKMLDVIKGQSVAALIAISIEMILWPLFPSPAGQLLCLIPATLVFALLRSHRRMSLTAPDYAITVFCLLSPSYLPYVETTYPPLKAVMAAMGGILGYFAFLTIFPTDARARRKSLWAMIKRDIHQLAAPSRVGISPEGWRLSFAARFLKIAHWATLEAGVYEKSSLTMQKGFVTMRMAEAVFMLKTLERRAGLSQPLRRAVATSLARIAISTRENAKLSQDISALTRRLQNEDFIDEARILRDLAMEMQRTRLSRPH